MPSDDDVRLIPKCDRSFPPLLAQSLVHPLIRRRKSQHGEWTRTDLWFIFSRLSARFGPLETPISRYIRHCILVQLTKPVDRIRFPLPPRSRLNVSLFEKPFSLSRSRSRFRRCYLAIALVSSPSSLRLRLRHPRIVLVGTAFPPNPRPSLCSLAHVSFERHLSTGCVSLFFKVFLES